MTLLKVRKLGFVGSLQGMTLEQLKGVSQVLHTVEFRRVNHRDYLGADSQFHALIRKEYPLVEIAAYTSPETAEKYRSHLPADWYYEAGPHGQMTPESRDHRLVFESRILLAAPQGGPTPLVSGKRQVVWGIIGYALQVKRPVIVIDVAGGIDWHFVMSHTQSSHA